MSHRRSLAAVLTVAAAGALACARAPEPPRHEVADLVALLPAATFAGETELIDLGEHQARRHLADGWLDDQPEHSQGRSWLWSRGNSSTLRLWLGAPRTLRAELRCRPHERFADGLTVEVVTNGERVAAVELSAGPRVYAVELPAGALRAGENLVTFEYLPTGKARVYGRRAVAWESIRLRDAASSPSERTEPAAAELRVPVHGEVAFALEVPPGARLETGLRADGTASELAVVVEDEAGGRTERRLRPGERCCEPVPLAGDATRLVRLVLRGEPAGETAGSGVLRLVAPRVTAPETETEAETDAVAEVAGAQGAAPPANAAAATTARPAPGIAPAGAATAPEHRPNLIVYLVDTLRADRLGVYGHPGGLTPNLDAFAREAVVFDNAVAQAPWTRPSVASLFTGLEPLDHGVWNLQTKLTDGAVTLAERLRDAGYRTAAFSTNMHVTGVFGLSQGFEDFTFLAKNPDSREVNRLVTQWLDTVDGERPFFLYVHTIDPHEPYDPPDELRQRFLPDAPPGYGRKPSLDRLRELTGEERREAWSRLARLYDAEVVHNDRSFGAFVAELRRRGLYDDAWVVMLADHGEEFGEHGALGHSNNLHAPTIDIPLLVKPPRQREGRREPRLVQQIDVTVTLLRAAGVPVPPELPGQDLLQPPPAAAPRAVYSHLANHHFALSVRRDGWKLIQPLEEPDAPPRLYRRTRAGDGGEASDLAAEHPLRTDYLRSLLVMEIARPRRHSHGEEAEIDRATREGLRALGYL